MEHYENEGIKANKKGNYYVVDSVFLLEMLESKRRGELTPKALQMMSLIAINICKKKKFPRPEDRDDCYLSGMFDAIKKWDKFDPEKSSSPFAYFTSVITNGVAKGWNTLYGKIKLSEMTSLDNNIHTL